MIERALSLLRELSLAERPLSLPELGRRLAIPKPTLHRLARGMEDLGYIARTEDGRSLVPGPRLTEIGLGVVRFQASRAPVHAVLEDLAGEVGETCNLVTLDGHKIRYTDRVETAWPLRLAFRIGQHVPMHATSTGKLLLALQPEDRQAKLLSALKLERLTERTIADPVALAGELAAIRRRGYSTDNEEFLPGMVAVAVPVRIDDGPPVAAVSIHAPTQRRTIDDLAGHLPRLRDAAAKIGRLLAPS